MTRAFAVLALAAMLSLPSCAKSPRPDIPPYPDAQGVKGQGTTKSEKTVVFNSRWVTSATNVAVKTFYENALLSRPGWTMTGNLDDRFQFTDGNMVDQQGAAYWPKDETKPGGVVTVQVSLDRCLIEIWQAVPVK